MQYKHSKVENGFDVTNLERLFDLCKTSFGPDYHQWKKQNNLHQVLYFAHRYIYSRTDPYKKGGGLLLQIEFLARANSVSRETRKKRGSYNDALLAALSVGLIDRTFCKNYLV